MAEITAQLIFYRLREIFNSSLETVANFDFEEHDILNILIFLWCTFSLLVVTVFWIYDNLFASPELTDEEKEEEKRILAAQRARAQRQNSFFKIEFDEKSSSLLTSAPVAPQKHEPILSTIIENTADTKWLNTIISWWISNCFTSKTHKVKDNTCISDWLTSLNEALKNDNKDEVTFLSILPESALELKLDSLSSKCGKTGKDMNIYANVSANDIVFRVRSRHNARATECEVSLVNVKGRILATIGFSPKETFLAKIRFADVPTTSVRVKILHGAIGVESAVESAVRRAVENFQLELNVGEHNSVSTPTAPISNFPRAAAVPIPGAPSAGSVLQRVASTQSDNSLPRIWRPPPSSTRPLFVNTTHENHRPANESSRTQLERAPSPIQTSRRLLVKLVKASSLSCNSTSGVCHNSFAVLQLDEPYQRHNTGAMPKTVHPFWDQHFLLELNSNSRRLTIEVFDREKRSDIFLGHVVIDLRELQLSSSRMIQPLRGRPGRNDDVTGLLTFELLFMEASSVTEDHIVPETATLTTNNTDTNKNNNNCSNILVNGHSKSKLKSRTYAATSIAPPPVVKVNPPSPMRQTQEEHIQKTAVSQRISATEGDVATFMTPPHLWPDEHKKSRASSSSSERVSSKSGASSTTTVSSSATGGTSPVVTVVADNQNPQLQQQQNAANHLQHLNPQAIELERLAVNVEESKTEPPAQPLLRPCVNNVSPSLRRSAPTIATADSNVNSLSVTTEHDMKPQRNSFTQRLKKTFYGNSKKRRSQSAERASLQVIGGGELGVIANTNLSVDVDSRSTGHLVSPSMSASKSVDPLTEVGSSENLQKSRGLSASLKRIFSRKKKRKNSLNGDYGIRPPVAAPINYPQYPQQHLQDRHDYYSLPRHLPRSTSSPMDDDDIL